MAACRGIGVATLVACLVLLAAPGGAGARTYRVTQTADHTGPCNDRCTLREAVIRTNQSPADDRITLPAGTYRLTLGADGEDASLEGDLDFSELSGGGLKLVGAGAHKTVIDGAGTDRVIHAVDDLNGAGPKVAISGVSIKGGRSSDDGGGVRVGPLRKVTLSSTRITGNKTVPQGLEADGGAIETAGALRLIRSTVAANVSSGDGAGISQNSSLGELTVLRSTISGSRAGSSGNGGDGGALYIPSGTAAIANSTLSNNRARGPSADGGALYAGGTVDLVHVTVARNEAASSGGGIYVTGANEAFINNSLIALNQGSGDNCGGNTAMIDSDGGNLENKDSCDFADPNDLPETPPKLKPLADNGGSTRTRALEASSKAVNGARDALCEPTDQRGVKRPQGPRCDIGAFELRK